MSPSLVLQLLLLLFKPPGSLPADDNLPLPELLSLCALGLAHIGLAPVTYTTKLTSTLYMTNVEDNRTRVWGYL